MIHVAHRLAAAHVAVGLGGEEHVADPLDLLRLALAEVLA